MSKKRDVPAVLRAALQQELEVVAGFPRQIIENEELSARERLEAWELLAKYGLGTASEVKQTGEITHGVVMLPPLDQKRLPPDETVVESDDIELVP